MMNRNGNGGKKEKLSALCTHIGINAVLP